MHIRICGTLSIAVAFSLIIYFVTGCGCSRDNGPSLEDIPRYPNATKLESMAESFFGVVDVEIEQYATDDSYERVMKFYTNALKKYETKVATYEDEQGRQTAIEIELKNDKITVAIQEFAEEGKVSITLMGAKS
jgi:hypothetical protein